MRTYQSNSGHFICPGIKALYIILLFFAFVFVNENSKGSELVGDSLKFNSVKIRPFKILLNEFAMTYERKVFNKNIIYVSGSLLYPGPVVKSLSENGYNVELGYKRVLDDNYFFGIGYRFQNKWRLNYYIPERALIPTTFEYINSGFGDTYIQKNTVKMLGGKYFVFNKILIDFTLGAGYTFKTVSDYVEYDSYGNSNIIIRQWNYPFVDLAIGIGLNWD